MNFVNNYTQAITLAEGADTLALSLPNGAYRLVITNPERNTWEIVLATVTAGAAALTRAQEGTSRRTWTTGSVIYCALTAAELTQLFASVATLQTQVGTLTPLVAQVADLQSRVSALEGGSGSTNTLLIDSDGNHLVDDQGNQLIMGA